MVESVVMYGAEILGWVERQKIERIQEKYIRWILGLDWRTPGYIVTGEGKREKLRTKAGRRAMKYEEKLREGKGSELARKCWEEIKKAVYRR